MLGIYFQLEVKVVIKPNNESEDGEGCAEVIDGDKENRLLDYEVISEGKYRCRDCGMLFDTLEAHGEHHSKMHGRVDDYPNPNQEMTM